MARPVEESMKFSLQSVKISTQIRKKMIDSAYLDNANLTSVTLTPNSRRPMVSTQPYGYVRDTSGLRSLAHHFELYFNRMNKLQESYLELRKQLKNEQQQVKSINDCEVELRICFDSVPQIFFDSDFDLSDPVMFSVVLDPNEHFKVMSYKLTGYLDLVEVCLNEQISIQSDSLFAAIKQLQEFQVHVSETLQAIHGLSGSMQAIQSRHTIPPLLIPVYTRRIQNLRKVQKITDQIASIRSTLNQARSYLNQNRFEESFVCIQKCKSFLRGDLGGVKALSGVVAILDSTQDLLCKKLTNHFITLCLSDEEEEKKRGREEKKKKKKEEGAEAEAEAEAEADDESESENANQEPSNSLEDRLRPIFYALLNLKWLLKSLEQYKEKAELQLQEIVSTVMTICLGPESLTNPVILRQLPHKDFVTTLDVLCEQFLKSAQRSRRVVAVCLNILATIPTKQDNAKSSSVDDVLGVEDVLAITDAERTALQQHLQTLHTSTWSRMQQHISTMLDARSEIHSQLQIDELKQVWDHCMDFVSVAGRIYNTKGMLLLHTLLRQARDSLEYLHKSQLLMLQNLLHEELWKPALVPSALQNELTHLQENPRTAALLVRTSTTDVISAHPRLLIGSQSFCVTHSMLEFVKMLLHYLLYARSFQGLGPEVMHRILELFRTFNTSSRSLVLNAGAVSQGFLKRISARHIALVTQCLSAAMSLVTVAQTCLVLYLPSKQHPVLMQLSQGMIELFADHRSQLFEKFPEIIKSVAEKSCSNLESVDWNEAVPPPSPYMDQLIKKIEVLLSQLKPILPDDQIQTIFSRILSELSLFFVSRFETVDPQSISLAGRERILGDVGCLLSVFRGIPGIVERGLTLENAFRDRYGITQKDKEEEVGGGGKSCFVC